ncbi:T-complex 10 C-terminal domain-containing protein [Haloechinothrix halophila]|uniref:T-complex 10 C-terminal domain-containing protein n=1 Tax=Haloechinothrix halophila TaxID=1069073 RepID=UPI0003FB81AD|nr:T-complex 10 C-terminal domain-containing protein [Haloechinothrix halophila]
MPADEQDQYIINEVPPSERTQFISTLQTAAAIDEGKFGGLLDLAMRHINSHTRASELSDQAIKQASSEVTEYVEGVEAPNGNYLAIPHEELKRWSVDNNEPSRIGEISSGYTSIREAFEQANEALSNAVRTTRDSWEGEAADQATHFVDGLAKYSETSTNNARLAAEVTNQQAEASSSFKNAMPEPIPFSYEEEMARARAASGPEGVAILEQAQQKQAESQQAHEEAARIAQEFEQQTYASASKQPVFAEPPKFGSGGSSGGTAGGSGGSVAGGGTAGGPSVGSPAGSGAAYSPSYSGGGSTAAPSTQQPSTHTPSGSGAGEPVRLPDGSLRYPDGSIHYPDGTVRLPDGTIIKPDGTKILPDGRVIPPGNTTAAGFASDNNSALGGYGPTGGAHGSGGAHGGGALGAGGAGAGAAGGALGAGKGTGVGGFGPTGGGAGAAPAKGMGAMGRGGMGGMMGGAGAGKGQGGDDEEHQDKYYVKQEMDPGLHVEEDEYGEKLVDDTTGMTVVPPVIGD